jgi:hypothetical protein
MIQYKTMRLTTDPMVDSTMKTKGPSESDIADLLSLVSLALLAAVCQPASYRPGSVLISWPSSWLSSSST